MTTRSPFLTYIPLNEKYDYVSEIFKKSYGSSDYCISALFEVNNASLQTGFDACVEDISTRRGIKPEVLKMFHGTTMSAVHSISESGFDPSFSRVAMFGRGTYASPFVKTALNYCKDVRTTDDFSMVFLCDFAVGKFGRGISGSTIDTSQMDYSGNKKDIFVSPYKYGIIPKYLICFYKWAVA